MHHLFTIMLPFIISRLYQQQSYEYIMMAINIILY